MSAFHPLRTLEECVAHFDWLRQFKQVQTTRVFEGLAFFLAAFAVSAYFARSAPWRVAWYRFIGLENSKWEGYDPAVYDPDRIGNQVKGRALTKGWALTTLIGAALIGSFALVAPSSPGIAVYLLLSGGTIIGVFISWQAVKLCNAAMTELGLKWPPYDWDSEIGEARFETRNREDR